MMSGGSPPEGGDPPPWAVGCPVSVRSSGRPAPTGTGSAGGSEGSLGVSEAAAWLGATGAAAWLGATGAGASPGVSADEADAGVPVSAEGLGGRGTGAGGTGAGVETSSVAGESGGRSLGVPSAGDRRRLPVGRTPSAVAPGVADAIWLRAPPSSAAVHWRKFPQFAQNTAVSSFSKPHVLQICMSVPPCSRHLWPYKTVGPRPSSWMR